MSTWHQKRQPVSFTHPNEWTVVDDAPNQCTALTSFSTEAAAQTYLDNRKRFGTGAHCYLLPPSDSFGAATLKAGAL